MTKRDIQQGVRVMFGWLLAFAVLVGIVLLIRWPFVAHAASERRGWEQAIEAVAKECSPKTARVFKSITEPSDTFEWEAKSESYIESCAFSGGRR